ncbi:MAG: PEP-CTERM sorting domain-containing protein [Planctomycetota bacterium]
MTLLRRLFVVALVLGTGGSSAQASLINSGFENGFNDWLVGGHPYIVTQTGGTGTRVRSDYAQYFGWPGADVWFGGSPAEGNRFAVIGSNGNESDGTLTSSLWTAEQQFLSFSHAGNDTRGVPVSARSFARILDVNGTELTRVVATSQNDSIWRTFTFDLAAAGLEFGDQFRFSYTDGASWSVIDNIVESGPALASTATVPEPTSLATFGLVGIALLRRRRTEA